MEGSADVRSGERGLHTFVAFDGELVEPLDELALALVAEGALVRVDGVAEAEERAELPLGVGGGERPELLEQEVDRGVYECLVMLRKME